MKKTGIQNTIGVLVLALVLVACGKTGDVTNSAGGGGSASEVAEGETVLTSNHGPSADNIQDGDGERRLFVTKTTQSPNLMKGVSGADAICLSQAQDAGLLRNYVAVLSHANLNAKDHIDAIEGKVYTFELNSDNELVKYEVAEDEDEFWSSNHNVALMFDASGSGTSGTDKVWSGTNSQGEYDGKGDCNKWKSGLSGIGIGGGGISGSSGSVIVPGVGGLAGGVGAAGSVASVGNRGSISGSWINQGTEGCMDSYRIYCISESSADGE